MAKHRAASLHSARMCPTSLRTKHRRRGGIEPLHVSMPRELRSRPGTSPTHSGCCRTITALCVCHARAKSTARGFEPLRAEPNGFLVHHLNHSVTLSVFESLPCLVICNCGLRRGKSMLCIILTRYFQGGYGATVARLTPDQKVGSSNLSALKYSFASSRIRSVHLCR
jgi:hypothetical protein